MRATTPKEKMLLRTIYRLRLANSCNATIADRLRKKVAGLQKLAYSMSKEDRAEFAEIGRACDASSNRAISMYQAEIEAAKALETVDWLKKLGGAK